MAGVTYFFEEVIAFTQLIYYATSGCIFNIILPFYIGTFVISHKMLQDNKINRYFFLAIILSIGTFLVYSLWAFTTAFLAAIMFYVLSKQPANWLISKRKWSKPAAATLVIIISFFIILLPISLMVGMLYKKAMIISQNTNLILDPLKKLDLTIRERFHFVLLSEKNLSQIQPMLSDFISSLFNQGLNLLSSIAMMYFILYFMIININRMEAAIMLYLPFKKEKISVFGAELKSETFSNAVGIPTIAVAQGVLAYVAYIFTGVNEPGFWAILTGIASILPIIGTGLIWAPIAIYQLAQGNTWQGIVLIILGFLFLGTIDNAIRLVLAKKMADVHPLVTILGVIVGLQYFGITGLIFGPLIISYFIILLKMYNTEYQKSKAAAI
jgi:predicted PurR-regulated permease PerM